MLQRMGWNPGEGLGKNKEGQLEPLLLDVKMDKKGLTAQEELPPARRCPVPLTKKISDKHPVAALFEICIKHKWNVPEFEMVMDQGPDHKKNFLMMVHVNSQVYKPAVAALTKKVAKANAATACLQALGLLPKDALPKATSTLQTTKEIVSTNTPPQGPPLPPPTIMAVRHQQPVVRPPRMQKGRPYRMQPKPRFPNYFGCQPFNPPPPSQGCQIPRFMNNQF